MTVWPNEIERSLDAFEELCTQVIENALPEVVLELPGFEGVIENAREEIAALRNALRHALQFALPPHRAL